MYPQKQDRDVHDSFMNWRVSKKDFVVKHLGSKPPDESYVCKSDFLEAN